MPSCSGGEWRNSAQLGAQFSDALLPTVSGHKNYVPNMIAGACQADVGVLVISARKGEFEAGFDKGGQVRRASPRAPPHPHPAAVLSTLDTRSAHDAGPAQHTREQAGGDAGRKL